MKIVKMVCGIYTIEQLVEEFSCFEDAQDSYIDSYTNDFSEEISKVTNVNVAEIEFSDILWKNSYIDFITNVEDDRSIYSFNWDEFVKIGCDENEVEDKYNKLIEDLQNNLKALDVDSKLLIRIRFELNKSDDEITKELLEEVIYSLDEIKKDM
jgi:hypothetical protein